MCALMVKSEITEKTAFEKRYYQDEAYEAILASIIAGENPLLLMATGTGKTYVYIKVAGKCVELGMKVLILAHTEELVDQSIDKAYKILNIIPDKEKAEHKAGREAQIVVGSVPTMQKKRLEKWPKNHFQLIIIDECFIGSTLITTNNGSKRIDKLSIGDKVLSSDNKYHNVYKIIKKKPETLCTVKTSDTEITCTTNHLFFTNRGWIKAGELKSVDMVRRKEYGIYYEKKRYSKLHSLWERYISFFKKIHGFIQKVWKSLLFRILQNEIQKENIFRNNGKYKQKICFNKNERKQSYAQSGNKRKSFKYIKKDWTQTQDTRWKRKRANSFSKIIGRFIKMANGSGYTNKRRKVFWISYLLQNRYRKFGKKDSSRNRRVFTFLFRKKKARQEKRNFSNWVRVESVTIHKQGSNGKFKEMFGSDFVYDLSINIVHNYFANGILVHNCHHSVAETYQNILNYFTDYSLMGATATGDRSDEKELGIVFNKIAYEYPLHKAIKEGNLAKIIGYRVTDLDIDLTQLRVTGKDYTDKQLGEVMLKYIIPLANSIKKVTADKKTMVFMPDVKSSAVMAEQLQRIGLDGDYLSGDRKTERGDILYRFKTGKISHLVSCNILLEGFDEPTVEAIVNIRPTASRPLYCQLVGRGTRLSPGKTGLLFVEFTYNSTRLNLVQPYELFATKDFPEKLRENTTILGGEEIDLFATLEAAKLEWEKPENLTKRLMTKEYGFEQFDPFSAAELMNENISGEFDIEYQGRKISGIITPKQIDILTRYGVYWANLDRAQASKLIDIYNKNGYIPMKDKATRGQKWFLTSSGYEYDSHLMKAQASVLIDMIKSNKLSFKD